MVRQSYRIDQNNLTETQKMDVFLKNLPIQADDFGEEKIQKYVSESIIEVFKGCHQDDLKITMYLRGILLKNFHEILKEVSLVCGARTASSLLYYLYNPTSLTQQFKQTRQLDYGLASFFHDLNENYKESQLESTDDSMDQANLSVLESSQKF